MRLSAALVCALALGSAVSAFGQEPGPALTASAPTSSTAEAARLSAVEAEYDRVSRGEDPTTFITAPERGLVGQLVKMVFMLVAICLLAFLLLGKLLPRLMQLSPVARRSMLATAPRGLVEVIDRLPLDTHRQLLVVKVGQERVLVGVTEQTMTLLLRIDADAVPDVDGSAKAETSVSTRSRLASFLENRAEKGNVT